jgi:D-galactarolactone cycloisomerase
MRPRSTTTSASRIVRIDGHELRCRLPEPIGNSSRFFDQRGALLVCVTAADGTTGWGETWAMPAAAGAALRHGLAQAVLGVPDASPRAVWDAMARTLAYDRRGVSQMAMSAIDIAVWDATARRAGVPVATLLGGALRERLPAYVSGPFLKPGTDPYRDFDADIDTYLGRGFRAMKLRMGVAPRTDARLLARVRERVGDDFPLMVDLNEGASWRSALAYGEAFREHGLVWLEEPIRHDDLPGYTRLAQALPMALAGGEALLGLAPFRDYLSAGALDVVQPDLALCGGFTEGLRIAALADAFERPLIPHVWGTAVNFAASLQFTAVLPETRGPGLRYPLFEFDPSFNPLRDELGNFPLGPDGMVAVPDGPGLGIEIDPRRFTPHVVDHWSITA